ncbi:response regulator [Desertivirga brevis]|uniref:response regulator n=1 Tax=Desertivirga brevis TaxID=2810310 RepID=UPI001A96E424|nr:response regulator [Pedobacter sp. SYSU D00873]
MGKRILALDDDPDILDIYSMILTEEGYEVKTLFSPDNLAGTIVDFAPALILLDIRMGNYNGLELCKAMKESSIARNIPIVMVSGLASLKDAIPEYGADAIIHKPFDIVTLIEVIDEFLSAKVIPMWKVDEE